MEVKFYNKAVDTFIHSLEASSFAKVLRMIQLLVDFGSDIGLPYSKAIGHGLFELRTHGDEAVRLVYIFRNDMAIILHAFIKKTQKISKKEYQLALMRKKSFDNL